MNSNYMQIQRIKAILKGLIFPMRCSSIGDVDKGGLNRVCFAMFKKEY